MDPQVFLEHMEGLWKLLECFEEIAMRLVGFQLDGTTLTWYKA